jgi:hypothetical protein
VAIDSELRAGDVPSVSADVPAVAPTDAPSVDVSAPAVSVAETPPVPTEAAPAAEVKAELPSTPEDTMKKPRTFWKPLTRKLGASEGTSAPLAAMVQH